MRPECSSQHAYETTSIKVKGSQGTKAGTKVRGIRLIDPVAAVHNSGDLAEIGPFQPM